MSNNEDKKNIKEKSKPVKRTKFATENEIASDVKKKSARSKKIKEANSSKTVAVEFGGPGIPFFNQEGDQDASDNNGSLLGTVPSVLPVLPVRDVVVFNFMIIPLFVGREKSIKAIESALASGRHIFISAQKDEEIEDPKAKDLNKHGTVAVILRLLKMPDNHYKVLVQGLSRAYASSFKDTEKGFVAKVKLVKDQEVVAPEVELEALMRTARELSEKILSLRGLATVEILSVLNSVDSPGQLADLIAGNLRIKVEDAQKILANQNPVERLKLVNEQLFKEVEVSEIQSRIHSSAREGIDKAQKEYVLREQLKIIRKELGDEGGSEDDIDDLRQSLLKAKLPEDARKEADKQLRRIGSMHQDSAEAGVIRTYLEWMAELPWSKLSKDKLDIKHAQKILDTDHMGLEKVKDRILEYLSVRKLNADSKAPILCFVGPPGVGKTSLGRSIARSLGREFQRISLGGMHDEAEIRGHRRTYIGAMPGRIIQALKQAGTRNPVVILDEIDKIGMDFRGDPSSALLEVLDPEQNVNFSDHYLNLPFNLSKVLFVCTANQLDPIPAALRDRLEVIHLPGYTMREKVGIAKRYLLPRQIKENGLTAKEITFSEAQIEEVASSYTREAGLRNLERTLGTVCRKFARKKAEGSKEKFVVTVEKIHELLGAPRFLKEEKDEQFPNGVALGLAWTPVGGDVLHIEATTMKGKGAIILTGQLGDVMQESAKAAVSFIRHNAVELGVDSDFIETTDLHIHVPAGGTPKDGPSAGVTILSALISALTQKPLNANIAMTGEITLRGRVLPVGGIKEKVIAAVAHGAKEIILPKQNAKDLEDIPKDLLDSVKIHLASDMFEVLKLAQSQKTVAKKASGIKGSIVKNSGTKAKKIVKKK